MADKSVEGVKKITSPITQLYRCELRTKFDVLKPALVPKKKKSQQFDSDKTQSQLAPKKKLNLTESPHVVPKLNLKDCQESYVSSRHEQSTLSSKDSLSSSKMEEFALPIFSGRVLHELEDVNYQANKALASIADLGGSGLQLEEILNEDKKIRVEQSQEYMENTLARLQAFTEKVQAEVEMCCSPRDQDNAGALSISSSKLSPFLGDTGSERSEDEDFVISANQRDNIQPEPSDTYLVASEKAKAHALLAKEMEKELQNVPSQPGTPGRCEELPFEGTIENILDAAPTSMKPESVFAFTDRLSQTYEMQMLMANENKELQQTRYVLQEELMAKETEVERLERTVEALQTELRLLKRENSSLQAISKSKECEQKEDKTIGDAEIDSQRRRLVMDMTLIEGEVQKLRVEVSQLQTERQQLLIARQHAKAQLALAPNLEGFSKQTLEQFELAADNLRAAIEEVASLREHNKHLVSQTEQLAEQNRALLDVECQLKTALSKNKQLIELSKHSESEVERLSKMNTDLEDELNDVRESLDNSIAEEEEYRRKYLAAQQRVEELLTEIQQKQGQFEALREESANEIRLIKNQCQEKFASVQHLPSALNETQMKLQESQQLHAIAEKSLEDMKREMLQVINENSLLQRTIEAERNSRLLNSSERGKLTGQIATAEEKCNELRNENNSLMTRLGRLEEATEQTERQLIEKRLEAAELRKLLDSCRAETTRQLSRTKDRAENSKRSMQVQIDNLEKELAAARAAEKNAQKEKDEIRQKMQAQIEELNESLEEGQTRWRGLHAHVTSLQNSLQPLKTPAMLPHPPPPGFLDWPSHNVN